MLKPNLDLGCFKCSWYGYLVFFLLGRYLDLSLMLFQLVMLWISWMVCFQYLGYFKVPDSNPLSSQVHTMSRMVEV